MKKKNCICEFSSERSSALINSFRESLARQSRISIKRAFRDAAEAPAPRFWVSEARAMRIMTPLLKGNFDILDSMHDEKKKMYLEIFRRVKEMKKQEPDTPLGDLVFEVVNSPAPCSYITPEWAGKIIKKKQ